MQTYKAEILIGGLLTNTVIRPGLTASEIMILRHIHGDDAVRGIVVQGNKNIEYQKEYDRLLKRYGKKKLTAVFPGARPVLPEKLADVGIIVQKDGHAKDEVIAKGPNNQDRKTEKEKELEKNAVEVDNEDEDEDEIEDDFSALDDLDLGSDKRDPDSEVKLKLPPKTAKKGQKKSK